MDTWDNNPKYKEVVVHNDEIDKTILDHRPEWEYVGTVDADSRALPEHFVRILFRRRSSRITD
jgi:hypothetical protein